VNETPLESVSEIFRPANSPRRWKRLASWREIAKFFGKGSRKRWYVFAGLGLFGCCLWLAMPHLKAWRHLRAARIASERFHSDQVLVNIEDCLRTWPSNTEAHLLASRAARRSGDLQAARDHLRECQRSEKTPTKESLFEWTLLRAASGDLEEVEPLLLDRMQKEPDSAPLVWEALAQGCINRFRLLDATKYVTKWTEQQPDHPQALFLLGVIKQQAGASAVAATDFRRVVELDPERDDARRQLARSLLKTGRYEEALAHLEYLHKRQPKDADILVNLARCQIEMGHREDARAALESVLAEHPSNGSALVEFGRLALREGRSSEAEEWLRKAVAVRPSDFYANWQLYESLRLQEKSLEAKEQLEKSLKIQDRAERLGEIKTRLMSIRPYDPALHCELGALLIDAGYKELGESWLFSALYLDENFGPAHSALADLYEERGDAEKAAEQRRLALAAPALRPTAPSKP
jgi:tetratricopeptide (TPR) repeat protein